MRPASCWISQSSLATAALSLQVTSSLQVAACSFHLAASTDLSLSVPTGIGLSHLAAFALRTVPYVEMVLYTLASPFRSRVCKLRGCPQQGPTWLYIHFHSDDYFLRPRDVLCLSLCLHLLSSRVTVSCCLLLPLPLSNSLQREGDEDGDKGNDAVLLSQYFTELCVLPQLAVRPILQMRKQRGRC